MDERNRKIEGLGNLQAQADAIRNDLGISPPGFILYQSWLNAVDGEMVIVEADGVGHATLNVVEGDYPIDYFTTFAKTFETEEGAEKAAHSIVKGTFSFDPA
jgi:hypothetical protein